MGDEIKGQMDVRPANCAEESIEDYRIRQIVYNKDEFIEILSRERTNLNEKIRTSNKILNANNISETQKKLIEKHIELMKECANILGERIKDLIG